MKGIAFLWRRTIINHVRRTFKKPLLLVLYLAVLALLVFTLSASGEMRFQGGRDPIPGYSAILVGAFLLIGGLAIWNGLKRGTALFSMADVNMLFTAPIEPRKVLMNGIMKQAGTMLLASVMMLFQYPNMRNNGLGGMALLGLVAAYCMMGICAQELAAVIYAYSARGDKEHKRAYNSILALVLLVFAGLVFMFVRMGDMLSALVGFFGADWWNYVPIFGWARGLAIAFAQYNWAMAALFFALMLASIAGCVLLLRRTNMDYYEDVLLAAERANQAREDAQAGRMTERGDVGKRTKRDAGALYGRGAFALTGRMLREQSRRGIRFLDWSTLGAAAGPLMSAVFFSQDMLAEAGLWPIIGMSVWMLMFFQLQSGYAREFGYTALYLSPQRPFVKLIAIMLPEMMKAAIDGLVFAGLILLLHHVDLVAAILCYLIYVSAVFLFAAGMLVVERLLGASRNKVLIITVYIIVLLLFCVPGIILVTMLAPTFYMGYLLFALWNAAVALLVVFLCRNVLHAMDVAG